MSEVIDGGVAGQSLSLQRGETSRDWLTASQQLPVNQRVGTHAYTWSIALSLGVSIAVGVVSGLCPAMRAAHLDRIDALHAE